MSSPRPSAEENCAFVRALLWRKSPAAAFELEVLARAVVYEVTDLAWPPELVPTCG